MPEKVVMTALSPTMESGTIGSWLKKEGDSVQSGDVICEVETDKATMDYESSQEGTLLKIVVGEGQAAVLGETIAVIGAKGDDISSLLAETHSPVSTQGKKSPPPSVKQEPIPSKPEIFVPGDRIFSSPLARALAVKEGIDLSQVTGTGPGGRIVKRDVEKESEKPSSRKRETRSEALIEDEKIPVSSIRKIIAERLAGSKFSAPHYYLTVSVVMDLVLKEREKLNRKGQIKVSLNAYLIKFAAEALKLHREINSSWKGDHILRFAKVDIGLAVAQDEGLITPVVRDCGVKGLLEISKELDDLIERGKRGKLMPEEYSGATFTISNLGSYGIDEFTAVINPPASAILAVGAIQKKIVIGEEQAVRSVMKMTLSCDHRVIDGAKGAAFLKQLKVSIEEPVTAYYQSLYVK